MMHIAEVVDHNYDPVQDRAGRPYPRTYVWVRLPWLSSPANPDPISTHPIPVFINQQHREGRTDWQPLKVGTRVVVAEVDKTPHNPMGLAVIAYGPQNTDDQYDDLRQTVEYRKLPGNAGEDRYVDKSSDPVFGANADVGRTHVDGRGLGWQTRHPYPDDDVRLQHHQFFPDTTLESEHATDNSTHFHRLTVNGEAVVYTWEFDAIAMTWTLADDKGNVLTLDSSALTLLMEVVTSIQFKTAALGFFDAAPVAKPTVTGSKEGNAALTSLCAALASLGLITDSTT